MQPTKAKVRESINLCASKLDFVKEKKSLSTSITPETGIQSPAVDSVNQANFNLRNRKHIYVPFSLSTLRSHYSSVKSNGRRNENLMRIFRARIDPSDNEMAESELRRTLNQSSFERMRVIGQFNRGFLITQLKDDLFIVDQHAADEKANFERLMSSECLHSQPLIAPLSLELSAAQVRL